MITEDYQYLDRREDNVAQASQLKLFQEAELKNDLKIRSSKNI
jgi:hypothetical protein